LRRGHCADKTGRRCRHWRWHDRRHVRATGHWERERREQRYRANWCSPPQNGAGATFPNIFFHMCDSAQNAHSGRCNIESGAYCPPRQAPAVPGPATVISFRAFFRDHCRRPSRAGAIERQDKRQAM
jgi:hypothetical protein